LLVKKISVKHCDNNFETGFETEIFLENYGYPKFEYIISEEDNNVCFVKSYLENNYLFTFYGDNNVVL